MNEQQECKAFEAWYCEDAAISGYPLPEGIAHLQEGDHYGSHRIALNSKWEAWQARAALPSAPAVPQGWKLVPVEPTKGMLREGGNAGDWSGRSLGAEDECATEVYLAMIAAAPQAPAKE